MATLSQLHLARTAAAAPLALALAKPSPRTAPSPCRATAPTPIRGSGVPPLPLFRKRHPFIASATTKNTPHQSQESQESQQSQEWQEWQGSQELQGLQGSQGSQGLQELQELGGLRDETESEIGGSGGLELQGWLRPILGSVGFLLPSAVPAHALVIDEVEEMMRFSPEAWLNIYITTGVWLVLYFLVIPLVVYNYLRLRWYKRSFVETYFQFMLVFVFFPGMLLLAPFINFRRLPSDEAEEP